MIELVPGFSTYKCHKEVRAFKIVSIKHESGGGFIVANDKEQYTRITTEFMKRHNPEEGGYLVVYKDGYSSFSPQKEFEEGYREIGSQDLTFGDVIEGLHRGKSYQRKGWNGKGIYISLQTPDKHSKMTLPYIYMTTISLVSANPDAPRGLVPWLASQTDMLAVDWVEL